MLRGEFIELLPFFRIVLRADPQFPPGMRAHLPGERVAVIAFGIIGEDSQDKETDVGNPPGKISPASMG